MKPKSRSRTLRAARGHKWIGWLVLGSAALTYVMAEIGTLPIPDAWKQYVTFFGGLGLAMIAAGIQFYNLRLTTTEPVDLTDDEPEDEPDE